MALYQQKFKDILNINGVNILDTHSGRVLWVGNSPKLVLNEAPASDLNPGDFYHPLATIAQAMLILTATAGASASLGGDIVMIKPGYTASFATAAGLVINIPGVKVVGLGSNDDRPILSLATSASASINLTGANSILYNCIVQTNVASTAAVTIAAVGAQVVGCTIRDGSTSFVSGITILGGGSNLADKSQVRDCYIYSAAGTQGIFLNEVDDKVVISGCVIQGAYSAGTVKAPTAVLTNLMVLNNVMASSTTNAPLLTITSACTGMVMNNQMNGATTATKAIGSMYSANNFLGTTAF